MITVTVLRPGLTTDPFSGEETAESWDDARRLPLDVFAVAPGDADESHEAGTPDQQVDVTLYCPAYVDVWATDRVELDGDVYMVVGKPATWVSPFTDWRAGTIVKLAVLTRA